MAVIAYTNGVQVNNGRQDQFVAKWNMRVGDEVCCPKWVIVPDGGPLVIIELVDDGNEPEQG